MQSLFFSTAQFLFIVILLISFSYVMNQLLVGTIKAKGQTEVKASRAYALFFGVLFFAAGMVFKEIGAAGISVLQVLERKGAQVALLSETTKYLVYFIGIGVFALLLIISLSSYLFFLNRKVGILSSVANDDLSGSIIFGINVIVFTLISLVFLRQILEYIVPYPGGAGFN